MKSTDAPSKQAVPFGTNGPREAITATTPSGSNQASYDQGFPPITMTLKSAGGLPPKGQDMNQILFELSSFSRYLSAGGGYAYDSDFSTSVGGYPLYARIPNSNGTGTWLNTVEDNQTNPENSTAALTGWVPVGSYGSTTISGLSATSITLTTLQASKDRIILSGSLTANINIVVPAWNKSWTIVNNCTGAYSVTIKTPSGTGVEIPSGGATSKIYGDGTNIGFSETNLNMSGAPTVATANQGTSNNQIASTAFVSAAVDASLGGELINYNIYNNSGTFSKDPRTKRIRVVCVGAGGAGGGVQSTSSNQIAASSGGTGGSYADTGLFPAPSGSVSVTVGVGGAPNSGGAGGDGGSSSFGSYVICPGGGGGYAGSAVAFASSLGGPLTSSSAPTGSNVGISSLGQGGSGPDSVYSSSGNQIRGGDGGASFFGGGGLGVNATVAVPQISPSIGGGGGGIAVGPSSNSPLAGGNGRGGIVIVMEYR